MDKLKHTGLNLGQVSNPRSGCIYAMHLLHSTAIWPNLGLKTWPTTFRLFPAGYHAPRLTWFVERQCSAWCPGLRRGRPARRSSRFSRSGDFRWRRSRRPGPSAWGTGGSKGWRWQTRDWRSASRWAGEKLIRLKLSKRKRSSLFSRSVNERW